MNTLPCWNRDFGSSPQIETCPAKAKSILVSYQYSLKIPICKYSDNVQQPGRFSRTPSLGAKFTPICIRHQPSTTLSSLSLGLALESGTDVYA